MAAAADKIGVYHKVQPANYSHPRCQKKLRHYNHKLSEAMSLIIAIAVPFIVAGFAKFEA